MRTYPRNSPEAASQIVALLLIADGHVSRSELDALHGLHMEREFGLAPGSFAKIVHTLCEDLLMATHSHRSMIRNLDDSTLALLMSEVTLPDLQYKVLRFAEVAATADHHIAEAEAWLMGAALKNWSVKETHGHSKNDRSADTSATPGSPPNVVH